MVTRASSKRRAERQFANNPPQRAPRVFSAQFVNWIIAAVLALLCAIIYVQVVNFEFTLYDDVAYVPDNPQVRDGFSLGGIAWAFTTFETANWYPLTWLSLMLDCQIFGPSAGAVHAMNAILHAADVVLLFIVLQRMTGRRWPSAAVAALFAVHPLHVDSVAWVAERKDVLSTLFFLTSLLAYQSYVSKPSLRRWSLVFASMAVGLLCKPMLVTLPFVLLLLDYWPLRSTSRPLWLLLVEKLPLVGLSAGISIVTVFAQAKMGATKMIGHNVHFSLQFANATISYVKYLAMTIWTARLAVFYPYDFHPRPLHVAASVALLMALTLLTILFIRRAPYLAVGWFWFLGILVPTIGVIQVGAQSLADRYMYIPSIGVFIAIVWAAAAVVRRPLILAASFTAVIAALTVAANIQTSYWVNTEQLFKHAIAVTGDNPESCENLGDTLLRQERFPEAEVQLRTVLAMDHEKQFRDTPFELAKALAGQNRAGEAVAFIRESIPDNVDRAKALTIVGSTLVMHCLNFTTGIPLIEEAIKTAPEQSESYRSLAFIYATSPNPQYRNGPKAVELALKACELTSRTNAKCLMTLADAYHLTHDRRNEIETLRAAQKLSPKDKEIAKKLADALQGHL
jgi:hypothetical protein